MPQPLGVYDHPPPPSAAPFIRSVELAPIGVVPALEGTTRLVNYLFSKAGEVLTGL